ncbi:MFS-type transporter SLC18B1-like [Tropilaelaps mercedesae]|uniref:MFS-type transporter SLC18B1-like n=1 Tax=Tropilaelaps mercedesae TaxID=418985 RepID=A0A1V9Y301_9ACAR|nr:MFS-type transporter SLC18B1-like [Tropilaelaps mercedesae]
MLTSRQTVVIIIALVESFTLSAHYAVFMPFYPNVAIDKGNTHSQVGAFFAVGSFVGLAGSPFVGWLLKQGVPPKNMVIFGLLLSGIMLAAHGMYKDLLTESTNFFYANIITRIVHSIGPVAATTAIYPIVAVEMGEKRGAYLPLIEASYNMGLMIWPSIGAMMFDNFGYMFPFLSLGLCAVVMGLFVVILLPMTTKPSSDDDENTVGFDKVDFRLLLILLNITICYLIIGFNDITLAIELKKRFNLTHTQIGYCFAVATVCYGVCIYLWGFVCNTPRGQYCSQYGGFVLSMVGLFLLGPCHLVGIEPTLWVRLVGQALIGIGLAALFTASMIHGMFHLTHRLRLPDDVATHGFFSGLIFFSLCSGYLAGHAGFAGIILDVLGYDFALLAMIVTIAVAAILDNLNRILGYCSHHRSGYASIESDWNV